MLHSWSFRGRKATERWSAFTAKTQMALPSAAPTVASVSALHLHVKWQEMNAGVVLIWSGMLFIRLLSEELFHCDKINHLLYQHFY